MHSDGKAPQPDERIAALEQELDQARAQVRAMAALLNRCPMVVICWRMVDGYPIEYISENIWQFGYTPGDFLSGQYSWEQLVVPEDFARRQARATGSLARQAESFTVEYRLRTKSGGVHWVEEYAVAIRDGAGVPTHYQSMLIDITERKCTEEALRESEEKYRAVFQYANDALFLAELPEEGKVGVFLEVNDVASTMLGYTRDELLNMTPYDINAPEYAEIEIAARQQLIRS